MKKLIFTNLFSLKGVNTPGSFRCQEQGNVCSNGYYMDRESGFCLGLSLENLMLGNLFVKILMNANVEHILAHPLLIA